MKKMIENKSNSPMYVMGQMIPPGEMIHVDVPDEPQEPAEEKPPTLAEQAAEALKNPAKAIIEELHTFTVDALDMMQTLEGAADKPRKTVLEAIAAEKVQRADAAMQAVELDRLLTAELAQPAAELIAGLADQEDDVLARMAVLEAAAPQPRAEVLSAITAEQAARTTD